MQSSNETAAVEVTWRSGEEAFLPYDTRIVLCGRWDVSQPEGPRAEWAGSSLLFAFHGARVDVLIKDIPTWPEVSNPLAGNYLGVFVNGAICKKVELRREQTRYRIVDVPASGVYTVRIVKCTEAMCGQIQFLGLALPDGGELLSPPPARRHRIEIIGDSVSSGHGVEAPAATDKYHPSTVNATMTYGWLAAQNVDADLHLISWSGKGMLRNYDGGMSDTMPVLWRRTLPRDPNSSWRFGSWRPDVVVIVLGANDWATGVPPKDLFVETYIRFVREIMRVYRDPTIFCCLSSTFTDSWPEGMNRRTRMRTWLTEMVAHFQAQGLANIFYLEFEERDAADGFGADYHPSARTHQKMADTLTAAIKQHMGW